MSHVLRLSACAALVAGFFAGAWTLRPVLPRELGLDLWEWPAWQQSLDAQLERNQELKRRWQIAMCREQMKAHISRELIAGRITLREAARRFAELPHASERLREGLRFRYPGSTDEERMCRHVLEWAGDLMALDSQPTDEVLRRLRAEFQAAFGRPPDRATVG